MNVTFYIRYRTSHQETLLLEIEGQKPLPMTSDDNHMWTATIQTPPGDIKYRYRTTCRGEWSGAQRLIKLPEDKKNVAIHDHWLDTPQNPAMYSSPFKEIFFKRKEHKHKTNTPQNSNVQIEIYCPWVLPSQSIVITGSSQQLGSWSPPLAPTMSDERFPLWSIELPKEYFPENTQYKFVIVDTQTGSTIQWEEGENHIWSSDQAEQHDYRVEGRRFFNATPEAWRGAGVALPVFSLRSEQSAGIGDFADLRRFARWAANAGCRVIQVLPVNDTTNTHDNTDSYPYSAVSSYALHPIYLSLEGMGVLQDAEKAHKIADLIQRLNMLDDLDYTEVDKVKWEFFRAMYRQQGRQILDTPEFKRFYAENEHWLGPYAVYSFLRDINGTADFNEWGAWRTYDPQKVRRMISPQCVEYDNVAIYLYLQFYADRQLRQARDEAATLGVALKGDIPIGVSRHSVEAWMQPQLFNLDQQAGAPPDDFAIEGQNWGFPTYNWDVMARDKYHWWRQRFQHMERYFHMYRIDHILGFFRIWEIPVPEKNGLLGHFSPAMPFTIQELEENTNLNFTHKKYLSQHPSDPDTLFVRDPQNPNMLHPRISAQQTPRYKKLSETQQRAYNNLYDNYFYHRHNRFWADNAMRKLPELTAATDMMCCAEDLGMIPACVPEVLDRLRIITLEVQRMPKEPFERFGRTDRYPYLSVCTTSTHDMSPLRLWWTEDPTATQIYYNQVMNQDGEAPIEATSEICRQIIQKHLDAPSILAILPLQDWMSVNNDLRSENPQSERINIPSDPNHYWRYRMNITLEDLENNAIFTAQIREMIYNARR